jgi:hypothetical protein
LAATLKVTVPLPVPLVRPVREIHDVSEWADHSHDEEAATEIELLLVPDGPNVRSFGVTVTLQDAGEPGVGRGRVDAFDCCVTLTVWPATTIDADRVVVPVLDPIVKLTLPDPVPLVPPVSTTQAASACALHAQPVAAVTETFPVPPPAGTVCSVVESTKRQAAAS